MSNSVSEEQLQNFCSITGSTVDRARFYLEAANGDLDMAIGSFFEGGGSAADNAAAGGGHDDDDEEFDDEEMIIRNSASRSGGGAAAAAPPPTAPARGEHSLTSKPPSSKSRSTDKPRIATLRDQDSEEEEDDEEKGQAFYAGGSEHSGQQILGPKGGKKTNVDDYIKNLFQKARDHGAEEVNSSESQGGSSSRGGPAIQSTGYRLGTGEGPSEVIQGPPRPKPPKSHVLKLWKNGFTIDEETTLRSYDDPQNREFLQSIEKGEPPRELLRRAEGAEVHLDMQDQREQDYEPPKSKYVLYNDGYKLGSPTPSVVSNSSPTDRENNEKQAKQALSVNESAPATQLQIRLSDGSRLVIKANQTHTIRDIRAYINRARPEYNGRVYSLSTQFPSKELTDESQSLKDANVLNAVIIQKLTS